jgi:hypothetical protein
MVQEVIKNPPLVDDLYIKGKATVFPILAPGETVASFLENCERWCVEQCPVSSPFINEVVDPLARSYLARKRGEEFESYIAPLDDALDWKIGYRQWLDIRSKK